MLKHFDQSKVTLRLVCYHNVIQTVMHCKKKKRRLLKMTNTVRNSHLLIVTVNIDFSQVKLQTKDDLWNIQKLIYILRRINYDAMKANNTMICYF